jgi:hypothetical protein
MKFWDWPNQNGGLVWAGSGPDAQGVKGQLKSSLVDLTLDECSRPVE